MRRHPCSCAACVETIRKPWDGSGKEPIDQPRFANVEGCFWKPVFGDCNKWHVVEVKPVGNNQALVEEDVAEAKHEVLQNVASAIAESVVIGQVGAVATSEHEHAPDGHHLMEFASDPFPDEDGLKVKGLWLNGVQHARKWFQFSENEGTVNLMNVVHTDVVLNPMSAGNMLPRWILDQIKDGGRAVKVDEESHNAILDEILIRDALECDPTRVVVGEGADSDWEEDLEDE